MCIPKVRLVTNAVLLMMIRKLQVRQMTRSHPTILCRENIFFLKITSGNIEKRFKIQKKNNFFPKRPNASKCFQMLPNASKCIPMGPNGSEWVRTRQKTSKNLRKLRKTSRKLRKTSRNLRNFFRHQ